MSDIVETKSDPPALVATDTLRWLVGELSRLQAKIDSATGFGASDARTLAGLPPDGSANRRDNDDSVRFEITDVEEIEADQQWKYTVKIVVVTGSDDDDLGMKSLTDAEFDAYNEWELLDKAGYENTNVTGIKRIPNTRLSGWWSYFDGKAIIWFAERNEPKCEGA